MPEVGLVAFSQMVLSRAAGMIDMLREETKVLYFEQSPKLKVNSTACGASSILLADSRTKETQSNRNGSKAALTLTSSSLSC